MQLNHLPLLLSFLMLAFPATAAEQRLLIVTGELSGEKLGSWYLAQHRRHNPCTDITVHAVGGDSLRKAGATIIKSYTEVSMGFVGLGAFFSHLWHLWNIYAELRAHAQELDPTHIILVDCPLLNFPLARRLKKDFPAAHIAYVAPPEMWIWGKWKMDWWLKRYCDEVVVLYPFERDFYAKHGLHTTYYGWPRYPEFARHHNSPPKPDNIIAFLPGSRRSEVRMMAPLYTGVMRNLHLRYPALRFVWIIPAYLHDERLTKTLYESGVPADRYHVHTESASAHDTLARCRMALSKPGTITLELGLLGIPTVVGYKVPWLTGTLCQWLLQVPHVSLPNLLLQQEIYTELVQHECTTPQLTSVLACLYEESEREPVLFAERRTNIRKPLHALLGNS